MSSASAEESAFSPLTSTPLTPGDVLDSRYRVEAYLGGGGMASVYKASHVVLEQPVAVKVIHPQIRNLPGVAQRFLREARAATQLKGEHVARVSDVGMLPNGSPFMVMEYLEGRDLDAILASGAVIPVADAVDYVLQVCEALAEVHGLGIVHRDLKPANLFLTRGADGLPCIKLIDFGISRWDSPIAANDLAGITNPDSLMGSPRYMSPEQMESASSADVRSDIYGVGTVLYELLTRSVPHEGDTCLDIYAAATLGAPTAPSALRPEVPNGLDEVILRCLRVDPAERYTDAAELAAALAPFGPEGSVARAEGVVRVLEAARSRTQQESSIEDSLYPASEDSSVRRRVSISSNAIRREAPKVKSSWLGFGSVVALAVVLVGLFGFGAALYTKGHSDAISEGSIPPSAELQAPATEAVELPTLTAEEIAAMPTPSVLVEPAALTAAALPTAAAVPAATAPRLTAPVPSPKPEPLTAPAAQRAPESVPSAPPPAPAPATAPTTDERKLFEERK